jgi:peptide subunit release factor 1 (eRF1)
MVQRVEKIINKLQAYNDRSFPILSVYLENSTRISEGNKRLQDKFRQLVDEGLDPEQTTLVQQDLNYIDAYLHVCPQIEKNKGLALFSGDNKLWEVVNYNETFPNSVTVSHSPYLIPLMDALSKYRRYLVVIADRKKARYFTLHMGQLEAYEDAENPSLSRKVKGRDMPDFMGSIDRHVKNHFKQHFNYINEKVCEFAKNKQIAGVIVGGHKDILNNIKQHLSKHLQQKIAGEFISEINTNLNDIVEKSRIIIGKINARLDQKQLINLA